jgi:acyl carrier protein
VTDPLHEVVVACLFAVAPDLEGEDLDPTDELRHDLGLDSMDYLDFLEALRVRTGVVVPEADYRQVDSIGAAIVYLRGKT